MAEILANQTTIIGDANDDLGRDLEILADAEVKGFDTCKVTWEDVLLRFYIVDVLSCPNEFTDAQKECLLSKLIENPC